MNPRNYLAYYSRIFNCVEVRDISWHRPMVGSGELKLASLLRKHKVGWVATEFPGLPTNIYKTADFLYILWIGENGSFIGHQYERIDRFYQLGAWWYQMQDSLPQTDGVFGFFNNDYAGFAAGIANRLKTIAGLMTNSFKPPQQGNDFNEKNIRCSSSD